jgi:RhtB (resistance to homoserine/threonine) family protein
MAEFLTIALLHALAVISPGPDFAIVIKQSVSNGRLIGRVTALGVGTAILWHVAYSLIGVGFLANNSDSLFALMKYTAAAYLIYIGIGAIRTQSHQTYQSDESRDQKINLTSAFKIGFLTNGLNPKAALFFISLFTVVVKPTTPIPIQVGYGVYLACATALWFVIVATIFSHKRVRREFEKIGHWFDRIMGALLIILGLNIAFSAIT